MDEILLELVPVREKKANNAKLGRYDAVLPDGRVLARSRQPLFEAARALLAEGVVPETVIEARHQGSAIVAMRSTVGEAAKWTIEESDKGGLRMRLWKPFKDADSSWSIGVGSGAAVVAGLIVGPDAGERVLEADAA